MTHALFVACALCCANSPATASRPNILLIVTDDQGYWDTGISGNPKIDTPVIDRLAAEGVSFTRYYVTPVCATTRAGLMTGRYYPRTGLYNTRFGGDTLGKDEITVAQLLKTAGYRTGIFGKWHLGKYAGYRPHERGFDVFLGHYHGHIEEYDYPDQLVYNGRPIEARGYVTDLFTDAAIEFITASREEPFFCYLPFNAPHSPWVVGTSHDGQKTGDPLIEKYLNRDLPLREARIYAMIDIIDRNMGRLLKTLDDLNVADNTVVVFMSDNGGVSRAYKAGLRGGKASVWEGGVRSPFLVRWPGHFPAGAKPDAMASHIDLLPTFCELAGVQVPTDRKIDGRSVLKLLTSGSGASPHDYVYHTWDRYVPNLQNRWAISDQRYKLVGGKQTFGRAKKPPKIGRLYDLIADPGENTDLSAKHPEIVDRLWREMQRWFDDVTDGQTYEPIAIPVGHPDENPVEIQASWATLDGDTVQYTFRGYDWDTVDSWSQPGESAMWKLDVQRDGRYEVTVSYGCSHADAGGSLRISVGDSSVEHVPVATPASDVFVRQRIGDLALRKGQAILKAEAVHVKGRELMRLNRIWLKRQDTN